MSPSATATSGLVNSAAMTKSSLVLYSLVIAAQPGPWESPVWQTQSKPIFPSRAWSIEDEAIHSIPGTPGVDISTAKNYRNFECEFEWKIAKGANTHLVGSDRSW